MKNVWGVHRLLETGHRHIGIECQFENGSRLKVVVTEWGKGDWWDEHWDNDGEVGLFVGGEGVGTSCMCWDVKAGAGLMSGKGDLVMAFFVKGGIPDFRGRSEEKKLLNGKPLSEANYALEGDAFIPVRIVLVPVLSTSSVGIEVACQCHALDFLFLKIIKILSRSECTGLGLDG
ncbi:hypothetical protein AAC387_Pa03g1813 [Persea americana]